EEGLAPAEARRAYVEALDEDDAAGRALAPEARAQAEEALGALLRAEGDLEEAARRLDAAVADTAADRPIDRARRLHRRAQVDEPLGEVAGARRRIGEALALLDGQDAPEALLEALDLRRYAAWLRYRDGDFDGAVTELEAVLAAVPADARSLRALVLTALGVVAFGRGDYAAAEQSFRQTLALAEGIGDLRRVSSAYNNLGIVAAKQGDARGAVGWYERAVRLHARRGDRGALAQTYNNLGTLYGEMGELSRAAQYLRESIRIRARSGHSGLALGYANLGEVLLRQGRADEARGYLEQAIALVAEGRGPGYLLPDAWRMLAELHLVTDAFDEAERAAHEALRRAEEAGDRPRAAAALRVLGEALDGQGRPDEAGARLDAAVDLLEALDQPIELARTYAARGRHLARRGHADAAHWAAEAEALFAALGVSGRH
ncbi:MAG: tetratricopeptide repeat protein, partial [Myxococcales bacterium]|nr:tetratricopeptide repeat protein [Myxococcales bacterium]